MWNAELYNKFGRERLQPSVDLINRLGDRPMGRILDIGCGSGLSTGALRARWPEAEIVGVDLSPEMLEKAKETVPSVTWLLRDCSKPLDNLGTFDLVFSNAFLQWLKNQEEFLKNTRSLLKENGVLAIQLPDFKSMPVRDCINKVASAYSVLIGIDGELYDNADITTYYDFLKRYYATAEVWRVSYYHALENHQAILNFIKGTALGPYLSRLTAAEAEHFLHKLLEEIKNCYAIQEDGTVLFEFKRMFLLAGRL
ncbi:methyltransferase domain-containing protein [Oscillospiraceae bacterium WX1]